MTNPFLAPSPLPYELPDFASIREDDYAPALEDGMRRHLEEIAAITGNPEAPTFENTLVPLERSGQVLDRAVRVMYALASADTTERIEELQAEYAGRLAAHQDAIMLDPALFARIDAVHADRDRLDPESRYLVERYHTELTLAGAGLDETSKAQLRALNEQISERETAFSIALKADTTEGAIVVDDVAELDGLTPAQISSCAESAAARGLDGKWVITLVNTSGHPFLASLTSRDLRERLARAQQAKGSRGGAGDTRQAALDVIRLRAERARLLGFDSHAAAVTADNTAGTPDAVRSLLSRLAPAAARNAAAEKAALSKQAGFPIESWDWEFYAEKVRATTYDVDTGALRPWFEAERVLQKGVFLAANRLFGITFTERPDLRGWHEDVRVFEVHEEDGTPVGLYLLDLYARDSKRGGAWMSSFVDRAALLDQPTAVVYNCLNVPKPAAGEPTLLTLDECDTFFHEFGHALHGLLAKATYPKLAGTNVFRDFVEYPSQVNEMWRTWPEVLASYAVHHETGEPIPADVLARLDEAERFNEGFGTYEYLAAALLDFAWHSLAPEEVPESVEEMAEFERNALAAVGLDDPVIPPRYRTPYFSHMFIGYAAAYYGYIWSEVLDADTVAWFKANGGLTRANGELYRRYVIGIGGTRNPLESYLEWRGRPAPVEPLLERRGLTA